MENLSGPGRDRTDDLKLAKLALLPTELQARNKGIITFPCVCVTYLL